MDGGDASPPPPEEGERSRRGDPNQICGLGEYDKERGIPGDEDFVNSLGRTEYESGFCVW